MLKEFETSPASEASLTPEASLPVAALATGDATPAPEDAVAAEETLVGDSPPAPDDSVTADALVTGDASPVPEDAVVAEELLTGDNPPALDDPVIADAPVAGEAPSVPEDAVVAEETLVGDSPPAADDSVTTDTSVTDDASLAPEDTVVAEETLVGDSPPAADDSVTTDTSITGDASLDPEDTVSAVKPLMSEVSPAPEDTAEAGATLEIEAVRYQSFKVRGIIEDKDLIIDLKGTNNIDLPSIHVEGSHMIHGLPVGDYTVTVSAHGIGSVSCPVCLEEGKLSMVKACLSPSAVLHVSPVWYPSRKPVLGGTYILIRIKSWATSSTNFSTGISIIHPTEVDEETGIVTFRDLEAGEYEIVEDIRPKKSGPPYISGTVTMPYGQERKVYVLYGNLYDTHLKILFSRTFFLARVVRLAVKECSDMSILDISDNLLKANPPDPRKQMSSSEPVLGIKSIPLEAPEHRDNNSALLSYNRHAFVGMPTEDHSLTEGLVVYDLPFRMHFPNWYIYEGKVLTLFDLDFMTRDAKFREVILPRCFYYIGRMISSQKGVLFINDKYEDIRKVHSIWLIIDAADKNRQNTVKHLPKETVTETMNEILESIMLSTLQGPISTGFVKKVREAVSLVFAEELVKIVEELIEIIRARVYQNDPSVPPMPTKDKIMEALAERQEDVERVRTFLEATIITLGPYKDAKDDDVKFLDILIYERFNETQRSQILKDELGVLIPEELNKEVTHLMTLAEQLTSAGYSKGYTAGHTAGHSEGSTETAGQFSKFMESYMSGKNRDEAAVKAGLDLKESSVQKFLSQLPPVSQFPSPPVP